ncbi:hypothetical protein SAMN05421874_13322 [Nonomuraea maritima]|uniref:Uncharacterized protein n=1 Tax=Nonomuraea maritima TaxID=683260 RepID=A0A1G9P3U7_9ACTN|nr:hypothetical protein [Nonomuraea maritima]SDL93394.1 hypothetical protein SAMN05421874_13322 [Nonomuraea maritima]
MVDLRLGSRRVDTFLTHGACVPASTPGVVALEAGSGCLAVDPRRGSVLSTLNIDRTRVSGIGRCGGGFILAGRDGVLFRLDSGGRIVDRSRSAGRLTALRDAGAGEMLLLTTGTLRMITLDQCVPPMGGGGTHWWRGVRSAGRWFRRRPAG